MQFMYKKLIIIVIFNFLLIRCNNKKCRFEYITNLFIDKNICWGMNKNKIKKKFISDGLGWDAEPAFSNNLCKNLELFYFPGHLYYNNIELNVEYVVYLKNDRFSGYNMIIEDKGQVDDMNKLFEFLINRFDCKEIEQKSNNKLYILNNDNFKNSIYGTYKDGLKRISISIINKHEMPIECLKPED